MIQVLGQVSREVVQMINSIFSIHSTVSGSFFQLFILLFHSSLYNVYFPVTSGFVNIHVLNVYSIFFHCWFHIYFQCFCPSSPYLDPHHLSITMSDSVKNKSINGIKIKN